MAENPEDFADSPEIVHQVLPQDALSDLLHTLGLRGGAAQRSILRPGASVAIDAGRRVLHLAESDGLRLVVGDDVHTLNCGDAALAARGIAHRVVGDADDETQWISAGLIADDDFANPVLDVLSEVLIVRTDAPDSQWLPLCVELVSAELTTPRPGGEVMVSRIVDLVVIHVLRHWSAHGSTSPGQLTAALDPILAPVLSAIHRTPGHAWSVAELAAIASMSRTSFAERFSAVVGVTPGAYVTQARLDRAAQRLRTEAVSVGTVAADAGYHSEAAFSRAYSRAFGSPPSRWRRG